ncbi:MAG: hypothetical protein PUF80_08210 [Firmicutes bacterium]|nr:hypothetical protein [Bacillota bacterium]
MQKAVPPDKGFNYYLPKPDIIISYSEENHHSPASVTVQFAESLIVMRSSQYSYETKVLGIHLLAYDQNDQIIVEFDEDNSRIITHLSGTEEPYDAKSFNYVATSDKIEFYNNKQVVMEMKPVFIPQCLGSMQIEGWILDDYIAYLPYLCGLVGFSLLK